MTTSQLSSEVTRRIERVENGLLPVTALRSQTPRPATLAERMEHFRVPGVSIAVINDGQIEWARGYGVKEVGSAEPVRPATLFQAASISKPVAGMAALRLVQDGVLDLDEDVNTYLVSWKVPANDGWQPRVTLRHLLCHGGGLTVHGFPGYARDQPLPTLRQILDGVQPANTQPIQVNILPGVQFRYAGGGTTVMQQLLIDVLGKPFPQIMRELVLDPLGMEQSTYEQPLPASRAAMAATGHGWMTNQPVPGKWVVYPEMAAAGLWTTPSDLARFVIEVQLSLAGRSNKVLSADMVGQMLSPQVEEYVGLGPFLDGKGTAARFGHGGDNQGFKCQFVAFKEHGLGAAVMTNADGGYELTEEILRAIAKEYAWPDYLQQPRTPSRVDQALYTAYAGKYELNPNLYLTISEEGDRLLLQANGQPTIELHAESETKFFMNVVEAEVEFVRSDDVDVEKLIFKQNDRELQAKKVE